MESLKIRLQPKQIEFWKLWDDSEFTRLGIGGARGGGKSGTIRRGMLRRRWKYENTSGLILRRSIKELEQSHILKLFEEWPELRPWYNEQKKRLTLPNGSMLFFGSAPTSKDMADFYSAEFADIAVDESQEFSQGELERLAESNRCTSNQSIIPKMIYGFMPGLSESGLPPKGLQYLKRVFVDKQHRPEEQRRKWEFLQAFSWDNVEWARAELLREGITEQEFYAWPDETRRDYFLGHTQYGSQLSALTNPYLRDAWLFGKWDTFQGQYFPNFKYELHTLPSDQIALKSWNKLWLSGDWGHDHPACIHLHGMDEKRHLYTIDEIWGREIGEHELGIRIGKMCEGKTIEFFPFSWDAFGRVNKTTQRSITEMIGEALPRSIPAPFPADATPGSRVSGWRLMHQLIDHGQWTISRDKCPKLIECLPTLMRDMERNSEDVLKVDWTETYIGDDPADSARYGLQYAVRQAGLKPLEERIQDRIVAHAEATHTTVENMAPHTVATLSRRAAFLERAKRSAPRFRPGRN
jgi:phage terminase large subunit